MQGGTDRTLSMNVNDPIPGIGRLSEVEQTLIDKYLLGDSAQILGNRPSIPRRPPGELVPLSCFQQQVWVHSQIAGNVPIYNEAITIYRRGPLDIGVLERCLGEITRRHEIWRTTFDTINEKPVQIVQAARSGFPLRTIDLRYLRGAERAAQATALAAEDARRPFNLKQGPLVRATLVRMDDEEYRLYLTFHQIVFDATSAYRVFLPELATLYEALSAGSPSPLLDPILQYGDFACWQQKNLGAEVWSEQLSFWRKNLSGELPLLQWPNDRARPMYQTYRGSIQRFEFDSSLIASLRTFCRRERVSSYMTCLASYAALLGRYTGQQDIVIGGLSAGRRQSEVEVVPGYFVNPIPLRINLSGNPTFRALTGRVLNTVLDALANDDVPFGNVVAALQIRPDASRNPLFQVILSQQPQMAETIPGWDLATEEVSNGGSKLDMTIVLDERPDAISGPITYNTDLFDAETITRMVKHWQTFLKEGLTGPDRRIAELALLTEPERQQILIDWNNTQLNYPAECLHELIEAQVERTPNDVAVIFEDQQLSYMELNARANQLGHYLQKLGVEPEVLVGICVERSLEMLVGLLGILKAGGAYVPLNPEYPDERLAFMVEDFRPKVLLTQEQFRTKLSSFPISLVCLDSHREVLSRENSENCHSEVKPENLAYVIYTSGSTGKPKGVQISHRSLANFLISMQARPGLNAKDTLLAVTPLSFDIAGLELYLPLTTGARVVLVSRAIAMDGERLGKKLATSGATCMQATPATWRLLLESGWRGDKDLKILCGGEALPDDLAAELVVRSLSAWNMYGPTETTIWSTLFEITSSARPIPIGRPIANTQIYILDKNLQPVPIGTPGELCIGGAGLARGYLNLTELTAERFIPNPFEESSSRLYKTGDLARFLPSGDVEYLGRIDNQVKIRGFRIALGEIEAAISEFPSVRQVVVAAREDIPGDKRLVAYLVPEDVEKFVTAELCFFLKRKLPEYMIPVVFVFLDTLPLSTNGKVDRQALRVPDRADCTLAPGFVAPRDDSEIRLAKIWGEVLNIRNIGIQHNLFELGAHSLLVARLLGRIEREFGRKLTFTAVLGAPTIEQLAALLRDAQGPNQFTELVPIQPAGSKPPLFCIGVSIGAGFFYRPLSTHLGTDQPVIGVQLDPSIVGQLREPATVEELADYMVRAIRKQQPQGPYFLGGFCENAISAYETARQLLKQGQQVALLAIFEARNPAYYRTAAIAALLWQCVRSHIHLKGSRLHLAEFAKELRRKLRRHREICIEMRASRSNRQATVLDRLFSVAQKKYRPGPYPGRVALFRSYTNSDEALSGWSGVLRGSVELYDVSGTHMGMFFEPHVKDLASQLASSIDNAAKFATRRSF